jgi:hypothetical protein
MAASTPQQGSTAGDLSIHGGVGVGIPYPSLPQQQQENNSNNDGGGDELANHPSSEIETKHENEEEWVEQLEQGVTATFIRDLTTGTSRLKRLRFSKTHFTASTASAWYNSNTARLTPSSLTETGSSALDVATYPPPSVALSESVTTTPSKEQVPAATMASPVSLAAAAVAGGNSGSGAVARQMVAHGRVDSRTMSFDARELAQIHGIDVINTSFVMTTPLSTSPLLPPLASPSLQAEGPDQQEFHTPLTKIVNGRDDDKLYEQGSTGVLHSTGLIPSPALESLFDQAATSTHQTKLENEGQVEREGNANEEETENKNGSSKKASSSLTDDDDNNDDDDDDDDDDDASLVSASSGGRGRGRGRNTLSNPGGASTSSSIGAVLSPPPPRQPSLIQRPRSGGSNGYAKAKVRSFALSDVMSTASLSPTTSARSLDVGSGNFNRPGSQSPVNSSAAASTARGGSGGGGSGGSGLLRSVAAKIARSIIGGEEYYTNISLPSPTTSAPASSIEQQRPPGATTTLVFGGRRPKSASESKR